MFLLLNPHPPYVLSHTREVGDGHTPPNHVVNKRMPCSAAAATAVAASAFDMTARHRARAGGKEGWEVLRVTPGMGFGSPPPKKQIWAASWFRSPRSPKDGGDRRCKGGHGMPASQVEFGKKVSFFFISLFLT